MSSSFILTTTDIDEFQAAVRPVNRVLTVTGRGLFSARAENSPRPVTVRSLFTGRTAAWNSSMSVVVRIKLDDIQVPVRVCTAPRLHAGNSTSYDLDQGSIK